MKSAPEALVPSPREARTGMRVRERGRLMLQPKCANLRQCFPNTMLADFAANKLKRKSNSGGLCAPDDLLDSNSAASMLPANIFWIFTALLRGFPSSWMVFNLAHRNRF